MAEPHAHSQPIQTYGPAPHNRNIWPHNSQAAVFCLRFWPILLSALVSPVYPLLSGQSCFFVYRAYQSILRYWPTLYSLHNNYFNLALSSFSASGSRQLMFIEYHLVLSFLFMYSSSGLSTEAFS